MTFKLADKDKKLLLVLLIVAILGGSFVLFDKLSTTNTEYEQELRELRERYSELSVKSGKRKMYVEETENNKTTYDEILDSYNTSLSQEQILVFLGMVEKNTGVWLRQMGFANISNVYSFGNVTSTNPTTAGQKVYASDYQGISTKMTLSYECSYADFKKVMEYFRDYGNKVTVDNVNFSYSESTDVLTGTMQVSFYAVTGSDRETKGVNIWDVAVGTENIFASDTFITVGADGSYKSQIVNTYDLYMILNQVGSDMATFSVGQAGDPANETVVASDKDGTENIELRVTGQAGDYRVSYKVGTDVYPAQNYSSGAPLVCGDSLDLIIISKVRLDSNDNSRANITLINESDMPLNVAILNDDEDSPRINIEMTEGTVVFYED